MAQVALVIAAGGYIGHAVAAALRREGFKVYGLIRKAAKQTDLWKDEIIPVVVSDMKDTASYKHILNSCSVVVDASAPNLTNPAEAPMTILNALKSTFSPGRKKTYIYTSGILVYGNQEGVVDEQTECTYEAFTWRAHLERDLITAGEDKVNVIILRPGYVYGRSQGYYVPAMFFATPSKITIAGNPNKRWSWIHVDDLADAYVKAALRAHTLHGQIFNVGLSNPATFEELARKASAVAGVKDPSVSVIEPVGWGKTQDITIVVSSKKAQDLLGWQPKHLDFIQEMEIHYNAWKAHSSV